MARHRSARWGGMVIAMSEPEPDLRPLGTVQFADPSTASMAERINTFNEPPSNRPCEEQRGLRSAFGSQSPWSQKHDGEEAFRNMNRLRGVVDDSDNDGDED